MKHLKIDEKLEELFYIEVGNSLQLFSELGMMSERDALDYFIMKKRKDLLKGFKASGPYSDGSYHCRINGKQHKAKDLKKLEDLYIAQKFNTGENLSDSLVSLYPKYHAYRLKKHQDSPQGRPSLETIRDENLYITFFEDTMLGTMDIKKIKPRDVIHWGNEVLLKKPMTRKQFSNVVSFLRQMFYFAKNELGLIEVNPIKDVELKEFDASRFKPKKIKKKGEEALSQEEIELFIPFCLDEFKKTKENSYMVPIFILLTACRIGEVLALKYSDFDLGANILTIQRSLVFENDSFEIANRVKCRYDSFDSIVFDESLNKALFLLREINLEQGFPVGDDDFIFYRLGRYTNGDVGLLSRRSVDNVLDKAFRKGIFKFRYSSHDLRRTYASILHQKGVQMSEIQNQMRHTTEAMTEHYIVPTDSTPSPLSEEMKSALHSLCPIMIA